MLGESGLLLQTLPAWQVLLSSISSILSSFWEALLPPQAPQVLLGQHRTRWTLHCTCSRCQLPACPRVITGAGVVGNQSAGAGGILLRGAETHSLFFQCCCYRSSQRLQNSLHGNKGHGVFLRTWECHTPVQSRPLSPNLGSHKPQLPVGVKIIPVWLITAGEDFREVFLPQLLSPPSKPQWEIYMGRSISQDFAKAGEVIAVSWG